MKVRGWAGWRGGTQLHTPHPLSLTAGYTAEEDSEDFDSEGQDDDWITDEEEVDEEPPPSAARGGQFAALSGLPQ